MYTIEIEYITGNSFGSNKEIERVGCIWEDLEYAIKSLECIREHHQYLEKLRYVQRDKFRIEMKEKEWFAGGKWNEDGEYSIKVPLNKDESTVISVFWRGYFERLIEARVVNDIPDDLSFRP